jgi:catechol 2,3-dioxygenase
MYQTKIGHAHLKVRDLDRAVAFYTRFLGLREVERVGNHYVFLSGGSMHHEIALQNVGPNAPQPSPYGTGLYHIIVFEVPSPQALAEAYFALEAAGMEVGPVDHLINWAIYFNDPDGNGLEIYCDTRRDPGGAEIWRGRNGARTEHQLRAALESEHTASTAEELSFE